MLVSASMAAKAEETVQAKEKRIERRIGDECNFALAIDDEGTAMNNGEGFLDTEKWNEPQEGNMVIQEGPNVLTISGVNSGGGPTAIAAQFDYWGFQAEDWICSANPAEGFTTDPQYEATENDQIVNIGAVGVTKPWNRDNIVNFFNDQSTEWFWHPDLKQRTVTCRYRNLIYGTKKGQRCAASAEERGDEFDSQKGRCY